MSRRNRRLGHTLLALAVPLLCGLQPASAQPADPHDAAVARARAGDHAGALAVLERLAAERPDDRRLAFDRIAVLGWAGRDAQALALAASVDLARAPGYVLEAIGRAARNQKRFDVAQAAYRRSMASNPQRLEGRIGLALTLSDQGQHPAAIRLLDEALAAAGEPAGRAELLGARAAVAESADDWVGALSWHQKTLTLDPRRREALLGVIRVATRLGAPQLAAGIAARHPGLLSQAEAAAIADDAAALNIRWGRIQERIESGDARFGWIDQALRHSEPAAQRLDDALLRDPAGAAAAIEPAARRLLADRIVALDLRRRPQAAIALYRSMLDAGLPVPVYARKAAADAMLAARQPESAVPLYREVLDAQPEDFDAALGLFFALVESERLDEASAHADALAARTPKWRAPNRANPDAVTARTAQALGRLYGDRLDEAERRTRALLDEVPYSAQVREAFAATALARGWPRLADEEFQRALAVDAASAGARAERVAPLLEVHEWAQAQAQLRDAAARRPDDHRVERAQDLWTVHNLRQLELSAGFGRSSDATPTGSDDWRLDARLYTQPLAHHWRVFAQTSTAHAEFASATARWHREGLGAEYRARDLRLSAALTGGSSGRTGVEASGAWRIDDHWSLELLGSSVSNKVPMQAWLANVRASEASATGRYAVHESRNFAVGVTRMGFSDGNDRTGYWGSWFERWVSEPRWRLESTASLGASRNSLDTAAYFNPESDLSATVEVAGEWLTWRRYERSFRQRLGASFGRYQQQGFGDGAFYGITYEHIWEFDRRLNLRYGIGRLLRPYDGERSGRTFGSIMLDWRF